MNQIDAVKRPKKAKVSLFGILIAFIIIYTVTPIVPQIVSDYLSTYAYMLLVLLVFAVLFLSGGMENLLSYLLFLLPLILLEALSFSRSGEVLLWGYQVLLSLLPMLLGYYLVKKKPTFTPFLQKTLLLVLLITLLTTCIGLIRYPLASRALATIESSDSPILRLYNYNNIGGYDFVYYIVLLYPVLILAYKQKKVGRFVMILGAVAAVALSLISEYTTAFLLVLLSSVFLLFRRNLSVKRIVLYSFLGLLLLTLLGSLFSRLLVWLSNIVQSEEMAYRLYDLSKGWGGLENSEDARLPLYLRSLSSFWEAPLFGSLLSATRGAGGHSFILDSLAHYGLFGGAILFLIYRKIYRTFFLPYQKQNTFGYVFWIFLQTLILSLVNTGMWLWVLCFFVPLFLPAIYGTDEAPLANPATQPENTTPSTAQPESATQTLPQRTPSRRRF